MIYPGQTDGLNITLSYSNIKSFSKNLKYTINGKHSFNLPLTGNIVAVTLKYDPLNLFTFKNERMLENKVEMTVSQTLVLRNEGNATANF